MTRLVVAASIGIAACTAARDPIAPPGVVPARMPMPHRREVTVPPIVVVAPWPAPQPIIVTAAISALDDLDPPPTAALASTRLGSVAIAGAMRDRATAARRHRDARTAKRTDDALRAFTALVASRARLVTVLELHRAALTADGSFLRAVLLTQQSEDRYDDAFEKYLDAQGAPNPPTVEPMADYRDARAAIADHRTRFPSAHATGARYLDALIRERLAASDADRQAAALDLLALARLTPTSPITEPAYHRAALVFADDPDPTNRAHAREALHWLAEHTASLAIRIHALYRLGAGYAALHDPRARDAFCRLRTEPHPDARGFDDVATAQLVTSFTTMTTPELEPLRAACATSQCPCLPAVLEALATALIADERDELARIPLELALAQTPTPALACRLAQVHERADRAPAAAALRATLPPHAPACGDGIPASEPGTPTEIVQRTIPRLASVQRCLESASDGAITLDLAVGLAGRPIDARLASSTFPPAISACLLAALRRHRWYELDQLHLRIPIRYVHE